MMVPLSSTCLLNTHAHTAKNETTNSLLFVDGCSYKLTIILHFLKKAFHCNVTNLVMTAVVDTHIDSYSWNKIEFT